MPALSQLSYAPLHKSIFPARPLFFKDARAALGSRGVKVYSSPAWNLPR